MRVDPASAASVLGKIGRSVNSEAQAEASRINGAKHKGAGKTKKVARKPNKTAY